MDFKYRLRNLRQESGLSGEELGKRVGLSKSGISQLESGIVGPRESTLASLANYFNVSVDYLMGRTDIRNPDRITEDDFVVAFSGLSGELTDEQKKQMLDIANALATQNKLKK